MGDAHAKSVNGPIQGGGLKAAIAKGAVFVLRIEKQHWYLIPRSKLQVLRVGVQRSLALILPLLLPQRPQLSRHARQNVRCSLDGPCGGRRIRSGGARGQGGC